MLTNIRTVSVVTRSGISLALVATLASGALSPLPGQQAPTRWQPWIGCWTPSTGNTPATGELPPVGSPSGSNAGMLCVTPASDESAVDFVTVANNRVVHSERVSAAAAHIARTRDNCPGWESATWSADNRRVLLRSEFTCANITKVTGSGVFAISAEGDFIQIQGTTVGATTNSRVVRYQPANVELVMTRGLALNDSALVRTQPFASSFSVSAMRTSASQPVSASAIAEVSRNVEAPVAIAWINEIGQRYNVDGKELIALANAGVSSNVIDMMVALSYPEKFAVRRNDGTGGGAPTERVADGSRRASDRRAASWDCGYGSRMMQYGYYGDSCFPGYAYGFDPYYSAYGYNGYGYGYYSPYNYYYGYQPVVIVPANGGSTGGTSSPGNQTTRGRAVKGGGYTSGSDGDRSTEKQTRPASTSSGSSGGSTSSAPASTSSGSGGDAGSTTRTAKPRTPPPNK